MSCLFSYPFTRKRHGLALLFFWIQRNSARFSTWSDTMWYTQMNDEVVYSGFSIQSSSRTSCNTRRTVCCVVCQYSRCTHTNCWGRSIAAEFQRVAAQGAAVSRDRECKHVAESFMRLESILRFLDVVIDVAIAECYKNPHIFNILSREHSTHATRTAWPILVYKKTVRALCQTLSDQM